MKDSITWQKKLVDGNAGKVFAERYFTLFPLPHAGQGLAAPRFNFVLRNTSAHRSRYIGLSDHVLTIELWREPNSNFKVLMILHAEPRIEFCKDLRAELLGLVRRPGIEAREVGEPLF